MYVKQAFFISPSLFYQLRVNDHEKKLKKEKNWLCIRALLQIRISKGERGRRKCFLKFFTKANNKKNRLMSSDFQKRNALYLKLFFIQYIAAGLLWDLKSP